MNQSAMKQAISSLQANLQRLQQTAGIQSAYGNAFMNVQQTITSLIQQATSLQGTGNQQQVDAIRLPFPPTVIH
ncbi:hypothetical protein ACQCN2_20880 [Brevibacillus ginsengisoli]|uniref:hypothetical protein n=1 Tax=Brevibacillus ginsengisoli TaxID=363854 RepID=UPI003CF998B5